MRSATARLSGAAAALLLLLHGACASRLPGYARPRLLGVERGAPGPEVDAIPYRTLERGDFRSPTPPPGMAENAERMGAATCARLGAEPSPVAVRPAGSWYEATPERLSFHALMDRRCSWWNEETPGLPPAYVLEHEQIHFALVEIEARRLNADSRALIQQVRARGATPEQAAARCQERIEAVLRGAMAALLERHTRFDEETSLGYRPEAQKRWLEQVNQELLASAPLVPL